VYVRLMPPHRPRNEDPVATVTALLRSAIELTADLARDAHLPRLLNAFAQLPPADRKPVFEKLRSEVQARQRSMETGDGAVGRPNPLASLYVRIYENERPLPRVTRDTLLRSVIQSIALMCSFQDAVRREVEEALFSGIEGLEQPDADALMRHHHDLLALAAWCERAEQSELLEERA